MSYLNPVPASDQIVMDFWQSLCSLSKNENPTLNNVGDRDEVANNNRPKNKNFFYLSVKHEGSNVRNCEVGSDQSVVIPSLSFLASEAERPGSTIAQLNAFADVDRQNINPGSQFVNINKNSVPNLNNFRVRTPSFKVEYPPLNLFSARPGPSDAVADGCYLVLQGFEKGEIVEIRFGGIVLVPENDDSLEYRTYKEDLTYKLTIV
jgi:hypothetical protein